MGLSLLGGGFFLFCLVWVEVFLLGFVRDVLFLFFGFGFEVY